MAPITASSASDRIESRRWPPDFISPGPRVSHSPTASRRATSASEDSRTSSARARVSEPSSALGQRAYSASDTITPSTASPRNSSRSLCGAPALRWVSACWSREGSTNAYASNPPARGSVRSTAACAQVLAGVEAAHRLEVGDHWLAHLVGHVHLPAVVHALDLDVFLLDVGCVADVEPAEEQILDPPRRVVAHAGFGRQALERGLDAVVLGVHGEQLDPHEHQEAGHAGDDDEAQQRDAALPATHVHDPIPCCCRCAGPLTAFRAGATECGCRSGSSRSSPARCCRDSSRPGTPSRAAGSPAAYPKSGCRRCGRGCRPSRNTRLPAPAIRPRRGRACPGAGSRAPGGCGRAWFL